MIGISLFAALSYAVAIGGRNYGSDVSTQNADLAATEIIQFGNALETEVARALLNGHKPWGLDFENSVWKQMDGTNIHTANGTCTNDSCRIFGPTLGLTPFNFSQTYLDCGTCSRATPSNTTEWGSMNIRTHRFGNVGTNASEIYLLIPRINLTLCRALNKKLNNGVSNDPPTDNHAATNNEYTGTMSSIPVYGSDETVHAQVLGKTAFCVKDTNRGYFYYHVLAVY